jgi:5-formyltetrahydrofolate cyclo-ligase
MPAADRTEDKSALRARYRALRRVLSGEERAELSRAACAHLEASEIWAEAAILGLYVAVCGETDCASLFAAAAEQGKTVLLPLIEGRENERRMRLVPCGGPENLRIGAFGIPEPAAPEYGERDDPVPDLLLVPGTAFDRAGYRLGQGGGFYDRLLAKAEYAGAVTVGLGYSFQVRDEVPRERFDMPLRALCTEDGLQWVEP